MSERIWDTRHPLDPGFRSAWTAAIADSRHANFALDPEFLRWESARGRTGLAVLIEEYGRRAAFVLRREGPMMSCGWPWRWQAVICDPRRAETLGLGQDEAAWLLDRAGRIARGRQVRCYFPLRPPRGVSGFPVGRTLLYRIDRTDSELLHAMHPSKRRMVRRALSRGYEVTEAVSQPQLRAFAEIQRQTKLRHHLATGDTPASPPPPGFGWREWELPWMWLLVATRDGRVESGLGDGVRPGGMLEGRAGGSTADGQRDGAFALLSFEEARRGRDRGHHLINLGGDTVFKREMVGGLGERVGIWCWLGGLPAWDLASRVEVMVRSARQHSIAIAHLLRGRVRGLHAALIPGLVIEEMLAMMTRLMSGWAGAT